MTDPARRKKNNKILFIFLAVFASVLIGGASATVDSVTCLLGLYCNPNPLTGTAYIGLRNASTNETGGVIVTNCTAGQFVNGWNSTSGNICATPSSSGNFIKQLTLGVGLGGNESPITLNSTLFLKNATNTEIGGLFASNCTGNLHVSGVDAGNTYRCSGDAMNGTVYSLTCDEAGVTCSPTEITGAGMVLLKNATLTTLGGTKLANCSTGYYLNGWNATNIPNCVGELKNGTVTSVATGAGLIGGTITDMGTLSLADANPKQPYFGFSDGIFAWLKPNGTTATIFGGQGWAAFIANGTPNALALNEAYYVRYASAAAINGSAGLTQTAIQTQGRYLPIVRTSIMTNASNTNIREYFGLSNTVLNVYFSRRGTGIEYAITYDTNASNTAWQCCSNDGAAGGKTCTAIAIDHTVNTPYNLTLNLSNMPTDFKCTVQNATAISTITKSSNLPSAANNAIDLGVQNVLMAQTAATQNYSIRYVYLETR